MRTTDQRCRYCNGAIVTLIKERDVCIACEDAPRRVALRLAPLVRWMLDDEVQLDDESIALLAALQLDEVLKLRSRELVALRALRDAAVVVSNESPATDAIYPPERQAAFAALRMALDTLPWGGK